VRVVADPPRWAVLSDLHGNLPALQAIQADARARGVSGFLNLGDLLSGPLWPAETAAALMALDWPTIAGNHERQLLTHRRDRMGASDRFAAEALDEAAWAWLAGLPAQMQPQPQVLCVHGTPSSDLDYLLETVTDEHGQPLPEGRGTHPGVRAATADETRTRLGATAARLVLCGHSHMPRQLPLDGCLVANPGSAGLPAFDWDRPWRHDMQTGTPQARYALVQGPEAAAGPWQVTLCAVDYDHEAAARRAEGNGRPDWADALRTGRVGRLVAE
jgi:predicted phosphodiesterase